VWSSVIILCIRGWMWSAEDRSSYACWKYQLKKRKNFWQEIAVSQTSIIQLDV
jgi:hypothetical protein